MMIMVAFLLALLGHFRWAPLVVLVIIAAGASAFAFGSRRALQVARRCSALLERVGSWRPVARAALAISIGLGVIALGKLLNR
jgi:hypothetical protein